MEELAEPRQSSPLKWVLLGCGVLVLLGVLCAGGFVLFLAQGQAEVDPVAEAFIQQLNAGDLAGAYDSIGPEWKKVQTQEEFEEFFGLVQEVVGPCLSRTTTSLNLNRKTSGGVANVAYSAKFANGSGVIKATFMDSSGSWKVVGWRVESPLFLEKLTCAKCNTTGKTLTKFCANCGAPLLGDK